MAAVASSSSALVQEEPQPGAPVKRLVKRRPARKQVEVGEIEKKPLEQTGQTYNLWYHKWAGGDKYDEYNAKEKSKTRVNLAKDVGYTRADGGHNNFCCLFFARGCCPKGKECEFLHRLPLPAHKLPDKSMDVFGRAKHANYRDDMGGVGSFNRQNRTLYIGKMKVTRDMEHILEKHFEEFGEIEKIKVLSTRGVGFVTFVHENDAQFAKEAMMNQSLDNDEVANVRWASDDPNPTAKVEEAARLIVLGEKGLAGALSSEFVHSVRQMDELEGIVDPLEKPEDFQENERRLWEMKGTTRASNQEDEPAAKRQRTIAPASAVSANSLLTGNTLEKLKSVAALKQNKPAANGLGALGGYGSDSD